MKRIIIFLLTGMVLLGFEVEGPVWQEGSATVSPGLGGLYNTVVYNCVDIWNSKLHYGDYFVDFSFQSNNTPPYNVIWGEPENGAPGFTYFRSDKNYFDTAWIVIDSTKHWCLDGSPGPHEFDFGTVIKHELGHLGGLDDVYDDTSVIMYVYIDSGKVRHIQDDDVEGMACLYGDEFGNYYEGFTITEPTGKRNEIFWCRVPVEVGMCLGGGNITGVSLIFDVVAGDMGVFKREDNVTDRVYFTSFELPSTGGRLDSGRVCVTMLRNGQSIGRKCKKFYFACRRKFEDNEIMDLSIKAGGCMCSSLGEKILSYNGVFSVYDETGRALMRNRSPAEILSFIKEARTGVYLLRKEYPFPSQVYRIMILEGELRQISTYR